MTVGGGFHRACGRALSCPTEKMLHDNAPLASAYLHAWQATGESGGNVVEETLTTFCASWRCRRACLAQDADTDGVEGLTFTWTPEELAAVLATAAGAARPFETGARSCAASWRPQSAQRYCGASGGRSPRGTTRSPPERAPARCSPSGLPAGATTASAARRLAEFLLGPLSDGDGLLLRSRRGGRTSGHGFFDDYANVANGLLDLHVYDGDPRWLEQARRLVLLAARLFADDERGGFFLAPRSRDALIVRAKDLDDNPTPSGNSMLAYVLLRLARIYGDDELERRAVSVFRLVAPALERAPGAFGWALCALDLWFAPPRELAILGSPSSPVARRPLPGSPARWSRSPRTAARTSRCSPARRSWTASPRSTPASALPAGLRSPIPPPSGSLPPVAGTEQRPTGAEDVAWDISDLFAGAGDPKLEAELADVAQSADAFRERYHGRIAVLSAAEIADAAAERERIDSAVTRARTFAHLNFSTNTADPARGALLARIQELVAANDVKLLFARLEWAALDDERAEELLADPALARWAQSAGVRRTGRTC